jgi:hypothetical protein
MVRAPHCLTCPTITRCWNLRSAARSRVASHQAYRAGAVSVLVRVAGGGGGPGQAGRAGPYQDTWFWLFEFPALSLLDLMMVTA